MSTSTFAEAQQHWAIHPGTLQPLVQSYIDDLVARGYREATIHHLGHSARHFCYWLNQSEIAVAHIDDSVIDQFARHTCRCPGERASDILSTVFVGMVRKFVSFLELFQVVHRPARTTGDGRAQAYLE
jgi:hypothetical protein